MDEGMGHRYCPQCGAPDGEHLAACAIGAFGEGTSLGLSEPGTVIDESVVTGSEVRVRGCAGGRARISGSIVQNSLLELQMSTGGDQAPGKGGAGERDIGFRDSVIQDSTIRIDASSHTTIIHKGPSAEDELLAERERQRAKYRIANGETVISGERPFTVKEIVAFLNRRPGLGFAPRVDVDGDQEWRSVWTVRDVVAHPELRLVCTQSLTRITPAELVVCEACLRPFDLSLTDNGRCQQCRETGRVPERRGERGGAADERPSGGVVLEEVLGESLWARLPPGAFPMGSPVDEEDRDSDELLHEVCLSQGLYVMRLPVSEALFDAVMGRGTGGRPNFPCVEVTWMEAIEFCNRLSQELGLDACYQIGGEGRPESVRWRQGIRGVRLLTEAEWEYACRAGSAGAYYGGCEIEELDRIALFDREDLAPMGAREPNAWGLYDMLGMVWEWVWDGRQRYRDHAPQDPKGNPGTAMRVQRGGSFADLPEDCRCAKRAFALGTYRSDLTGFRLAVTDSS